MIQAPDNLQNLNRYTYVMNNPVSLIDPSGYWFCLAGERIGIGALAGGAFNWTVAAINGHTGINSFIQGAAVGALGAAATIGAQYLVGQMAPASGVVTDHAGAGQGIIPV